jgi:hypothetical protein
VQQDLLDPGRSFEPLSLVSTFATSASVVVLTAIHLKLRSRLSTGEAVGLSLGSVVPAAFPLGAYRIAEMTNAQEGDFAKLVDLIAVPPTTFALGAWGLAIAALVIRWRRS